MLTEHTEYGWKTTSVVRKYYHVKYIGRLMLVDNWVETTWRLFPNDTRRQKCGICKKDWRDVPLLESVNVVIFKKEHHNKVVCDSCRCDVLKSMGVKDWR